jgi:hypothetical protein
LILRAEPGQTAFPKQYQLAERTEHGVLLPAKVQPVLLSVIVRAALGLRRIPHDKFHGGYR